MRVLVVAQDLRMSGTSEGIVSRSFIGKLRNVYPKAYIEVLHLKNHRKNVREDLLPIDSYNEIVVDKSLPKYIVLINKFYWRLSGISLNELWIEKQYGKKLNEIVTSDFDLIFLRSSGTQYELILGALFAPAVLKRAVINFHDPFPIFWDTGSEGNIDNLELQRFKRMQKVVRLASSCISPSNLLSQDLEFLYGTIKKFHVVPHQFEMKVFDLPNLKLIRKKNKKISISYHGAVQFKRNIDVLLDAYIKLIEHNLFFKDNSEFVLRIRGNHTQRLFEKYDKYENIKILKTLPFSESLEEQKSESDIVVILENNAPHSNILPGKTPVMAYLNKHLLIISPKRSELRGLASEFNIASYSNQYEIKNKLKELIERVVLSDSGGNLFKNYFSDAEFFKKIEEIRKTS